MIIKNIHSECQRCANLKAWNIHMNGDHDYCCRCRPSGFISKDLHQEPCERFEEKVMMECFDSERVLSQENINKLHMNGIYRCDPVLEWLPSYKRDTPYWCKNWTFKVKEYKGEYYMHDTYWTSDDHPVELTDENFDKFEYLFDLNDIQYVNNYEDWLEYPEEDKWRIPLNSGGIYYPKYVVRRCVKKVKERVIERMQQDIDYLKYDLAQKERILAGIKCGDFDYNLY